MSNVFLALSKAVGHELQNVRESEWQKRIGIMFSKNPHAEYDKDMKELLPLSTIFQKYHMELAFCMCTRACVFAWCVCVSMYVCARTMCGCN